VFAAEKKQAKLCRLY